MSTLVIRVTALPGRPLLPLPTYQTQDAAGMDLVAAEEKTLGPGQRAAIGTGLALEIPPGFEGQVRPRSGLALRHGVTVLNSPGTIDADYRGELKVLLANFSEEPFVVHVGDRVAQLVVAPVIRVELELSSSLSHTDRQGGGFGSTGVGHGPSDLTTRGGGSL